MIDRRMMLAGSAALGGCATLPHSAAAPADPWDRAAAIVAGIRPPMIRAPLARITDHGAASGFQHDARPAIRAAMASLGKRGGRVLIPAGDWRSDGPIHLTSGIELHLAAGATLKFSRDPRHYLPLVLTRWEGTEMWNYSPLIYARGASDIALTGSGTIDGQGFETWFPFRAQQRPAQSRLRQMGIDGVPVEQRVFGEGQFLRPSFVQFLSCTRVLVEGLKFIDSSFWMIHPVYCDHVIVRGLTLESAHLNSDGIDPDSSTNVLIENCNFNVGDDGVAIKAGRDQDGWRVGKPTARVVVRNCVYSGSAGGGLSIGSEMSGGVQDVYAENYRMDSIVHALYFKSNLDRGGEIRDVAIRNIAVGTAQSVVNFTTDYHGHRGGNYPTLFRDITIENVTCREAIVCFSLAGAAGAPLQAIALRNIAVDRARTPLRARNAEGLTFDNVTVNGTALTPIRDTGPETFGDQLRS
jgi:polygalacturonase